MLNYLWSFMILTGIVYAAFTGRMPDITNAALDSSKEAISLCITMIGVMSFWVGPELSRPLPERSGRSFVSFFQIFPPLTPPKNRLPPI